MGNNEFIVKGVAKKFVCLDGSGSDTSSIEVKKADIQGFVEYFELGKEWSVYFKDKQGKIKLEDRKKNPSLKWNTGVTKDNSEIWKSFKEEYNKEYNNNKLDIDKFTSNIKLVFKKQNNNIYLSIDSSELPFEKQELLKEEQASYSFKKKENNGTSEFSTFDEFITKEKIIEIPFYQRDYTWGNNEIDELLDDIDNTIDSNKNFEEYNHFMGNIILKEGRLVDGQQRLTTLLLLHIAYNNLFENGTTKNKEKYMLNDCIKINNIYLSSAIKSIINNENGNDVIIFQNYNRIYTWLEKRKGKHQDILEYGLNKLVLCFQRLPESFDENMVYETINSRGLEISNYDLIKAKFLNFNIRDEDFNKYEQLIEKKTHGNTTIDNDDLISFFRGYIAIKTGKLFTKDKKSTKGETLYKGFKEYIQNEYGTLNMNEEIFTKEFEILKEYRRAYDELNKDDYKYPITGIYSWLVKVYSEYEMILLELIKQKNDINGIDEEDFKEIINYFSKYAMYKILSKSKGNSFVYPKIAYEIQRKNEKITFGKFKNLFENEGILKKSLLFENYQNPNIKKAHTSTKYPGLILDFIERKREIEYEKKGKVNIHVEHIYPQTPSADLGHTNFYNEEIYNRLGNFLLLSQELNNEVSNKILSEKILHYKKSESKITKEFCEKFGAKKEYTENDINKRSEELIDEIKGYFN